MSPKIGKKVNFGIFMFDAATSDFFHLSFCTNNACFCHIQFASIQYANLAVDEVVLHKRKEKMPPQKKKQIFGILKALVTRSNLSYYLRIPYEISKAIIFTRNRSKQKKMEKKRKIKNIKKLIILKRHSNHIFVL